MCGRFHNHVNDMHGWVKVLKDWPAEHQSRFNNAPTSIVPIVTKDGTKGARWGLIPSWSNKFKSQYATFNARIDSAHSKPAFRSAWKHSRTCIVPMGGYFEWKTENGGKQPYYIHEPDNLLVTAGLYETWLDKEFGEFLVSFTMLTEDSRGVLCDLHDRMPVFLEPSQAEEWLETGTQIVLTNSVYERCEYYRVSKEVNNVKNEGKQLIRRYE